ncbi:MAG: 1-deoxy-D-xylulose-5-phosphate synthase [Deltaproteobacteria bacterium]|nr:MAG: 1-deoxy-D-xylulose-5-phosphate synthase [Deltaproteobacteria bacterium]
MENILKNIESPDDLRAVPVADLPQLAAEIRKLIIETVSKTGGHLASSLGVVELTIALHYVFATPRDLLVWDVGHQAYAHKILTGRMEHFSSLRQAGGLSGFPKRSESEYDAFGVGHSSTSISAALGMALAAEQMHRRLRSVAIIGDASMSAGIAFEALNHAGALDRDLIVVLNDNEMSISPNVGAMSAYLNRILTGSTVNRLRHDVKSVLTNIPKVGESFFKMVKRAEESFKGFVIPVGTIFEDLGFQYVGPLPGHDLEALIETFENVSHLDGPVLVHVVTKKGKGYVPAEVDPTRFHGVGKFDIASGRKITSEKPAPPSYTSVFGKTLVKLAAMDERVVGITAAMPAGTGIEILAEKFPDRVYDVGIAEQHGVTLAAGMASQGLHPFVAIYSTFMQRAFDQVIHDVALQNLSLTLCLDRAGVVGEDGPTHHGTFDISYLRMIPNMIIMAPKDENELQQMLFSSLQYSAPSAIRYPRGNGLGVEMESEFQEIKPGSWEILRTGGDAVLLAVGSCVVSAMAAAEDLALNEKIECQVLNCRFVKPFDEELLETTLKNFKQVFTFEENVSCGGFGSGVLEFMAARKIWTTRVTVTGLPDNFIQHAAPKQLHADLKLDAAGIKETVLQGLRSS